MQSDVQILQFQIDTNFHIKISQTLYADDKLYFFQSKMQ